MRDGFRLAEGRLNLGKLCDAGDVESYGDLLACGSFPLTPLSRREAGPQRWASRVEMESSRRANRGGSCSCGRNDEDGAALGAEFFRAEFSKAAADAIVFS